MRPGLSQDAARGGRRAWMLALAVFLGGTGRGGEVDEIPFTESVISTNANGALSVFAADLDADGSTDVLSASRFDSKIAWYRNDGTSPPGFTERVISTSAMGAWSVFAADLDGDGAIDVLSASAFDDTIAWYRNDGASPPGFTERVISLSARFARSVFAADLDGDGSTDVLSASGVTTRSPGTETTAPRRQASPSGSSRPTPTAPGPSSPRTSTGTVTPTSSRPRRMTTRSPGTGTDSC
ncbi:MAG: VCBS repeat-containing protein [Planctomycetes bacterium]|nr:VCBS repeat-containing protein [Planctomycetota bacterium]